MAENPISHVVSILKGAIEQIKRTNSVETPQSTALYLQFHQLCGLCQHQMKVLVKLHYVILGLYNYYNNIDANVLHHPVNVQH